jgi:hypothetical protein
MTTCAAGEVPLAGRIVFGGVGKYGVDLIPTSFLESKYGDCAFFLFLRRK